MLTALSFGNLHIRSGAEEVDIAVGGGFLEVRPDKVVVLADMAERAEDIDVTRAETARTRAAEIIALGPATVDLIRAEASLRRAEARLRVARRRPGGGASHGEAGGGA